MTAGSRSPASFPAMDVERLGALIEERARHHEELAARWRALSASLLSGRLGASGGAAPEPREDRAPIVRPAQPCEPLNAVSRRGTPSIDSEPVRTLPSHEQTEPAD